MRFAFFVISLLVLSAPAPAATIPGLFNTGVDALGNVLADGAMDPHYEVLGADAVVVSTPAGTWVPNSADSKWIWETASGQPTNVTRTFRTTVDLTGFIPATVLIVGRWSTDNSGLDILVNSASTGHTSTTFTAWSPFMLDSGFVDGINTIDFIVQDFGVISGFRAEFTFAEASLVPLPPALVLFGFGLAAVLQINRRIR